jgi:hypothetical protein
MKRPLAYITAPWGGNEIENTEDAARYCRKVYDAGFSPICPVLFLPLFLNNAIPQEHKDGVDIACNFLRRAHVLVVCGRNVDETVKNDIATAERLHITATTLDGSSPSRDRAGKKARKYGVDYAVKKDRSASPPKYLVFFKARDADALRPLAAPSVQGAGQSEYR